MMRFDLDLADGRKLRGVRIQGNGGEMGAAWSHLIGKPSERLARRDEVRRLRKLAQWAEQGRALPIYEPQPGHVKVYHGSLNDETVEIVDIRGAKVRASRSVKARGS